MKVISDKMQVDDIYDKASLKHEGTCWYIW